MLCRDVRVTVMSVAVRKLIARLEKQIVAENDPAKRKSIAADIQASKKVMKHIEHTESEETPDEEEEEEEGGNDTERDEGGEQEEAADEPPAKSKAKGKKGKDGEGGEGGEGGEDGDDGDDGDDGEDGDDAASASGEEEASVALTQLVAAIPGKKGQRLLGHLRAMTDKAAQADSNDKRIAQIERERAADKKEALVRGALTAKGGPRITPSDAKWLRGQKLATVQSYLAQRTKPIVLTEEIQVETDGRTGQSAEFNEFERKSINAAVSAGANREKLEAKLRADKAAKAEKGVA
jgi:hypothetical protein